MFTKAHIVGENISYAVYSNRGEVKRGDKDYPMSRSELVKFARCPAKWRAGRDGDDGTAATDFGSLVDCLMTSRERFDELFAVTPATYEDKGMKCPICESMTDSKKCAKCKCDREEVVVVKDWNFSAGVCAEWKKRQGARTIVRPDVFENAELAVANLRANPLVDELFRVSRKQVMAQGFWRDRATGLEIPYRVLIDMAPDKSSAPFGKWICDLKTGRNGDPAGWPKVVADDGYDVQAAANLDLYVAATGEDRVDFVHVVVENTFPFHVVMPLPALSSEFLAWGRAKYRAAFALYARCLATGVWPSYALAGVEYNGTQLLGPERLWSYRESAGNAGLEAAEQIIVPLRPAEADYAERTGDVTP